MRSCIGDSYHLGSIGQLNLRKAAVSLYIAH